MRKAIVGEEAHRGIRDEKAVVPAYNKRHRVARRREREPRQVAPQHIPAVAKDTAVAAAAADKRSKEGNDDNRR